MYPAKPRIVDLALKTYLVKDNKMRGLIMNNIYTLLISLWLTFITLLVGYFVVSVISG